MIRETKRRWLGRVVTIALALALLGLAATIRLKLAWRLDNEIADISVYRDQAQMVLRGDNIYSRAVFFPYTPYSQFLPAWMLSLATYTGWRFDFTIKLPSILADVIATGLVFGYLIWRGTRRWKATLWALFFALNPVALLISTFHGNLMALVPCLIAGAFVVADMAETSPNRRLLVMISALLLGMSIAMRTFPILLLPVFLMLFTRGIREALLFTVFAGFASGLSSVPYLIYTRDVFLREIFSYSGFADFGWLSVIRAMSPVYGGPLIGELDENLLQEVKRLFLAAYGIVLLTFPFFRRRAFGDALLLAPLLFFGLYGGLSAQYLGWILPLAIALRRPIIVLYSAVATAAMVCFYTMYHPRILYGVLSPNLLPQSPPVARVYALGNALVVAISLVWAVVIVVGEVRAYPASEAAQTANLGRWLRRRWLRWMYLGGLAVLCALWARRMFRALVAAAMVFHSIVASVPSHQIRPIQAETAAAKVAPEREKPESLQRVIDVHDEAEIREPRALRVDSKGNIYLVDYLGHQLVVLTTSGQVVARHSFGTADVMGMDLGPDGLLYALDSGTKKVFVHDSTGALVREISLATISVYNPRGLSVAKDGSFYIADTGNSRVLHIASDSTVLGTIGGCENCPTHFTEPSDVCVLRDGTVAVADGANQHVVLVSADGAVLASVPIPGQGGLDGIRLDRAGKDQFAVASLDSIWLVQRGGTARPIIGTAAGSSRQCCGALSGVAWEESSGLIYASEKNGRTILVLSTTGQKK